MTRGSIPAYITGRVIQALPLLAALIVFNFLLIQLAPGDPIHIMAGEHDIPPELEASLRAKYGLDRSLPEQLWYYFVNVLQGDLGRSFYFRVPVLELLLQRLPLTLLLMVPAWLLGEMGGMALGVVAAARHRSLLDNGLTIVSLFSYSLPTFWTGIMLLGFAALRLGWFPSGGMVDVRTDPQGISRTIDIGWHMVLPITAMAANRMARAFRLTRTNMLEVMRQDYIRVASAKGLRDRVIFYRHALRNACLPVITVMGISMGYLVGGSVIIETVFAWPGMGRLAFQAIFTRDYPVIIGTLLMISVTMILANLLIDIAYGFIDPRIRYS